MATSEQTLAELVRRFPDPDPHARWVIPIDHHKSKDCTAVLALVDSLPRVSELLTTDENARFAAAVAEIRFAVRQWENGNTDFSLGTFFTPFEERPMTVIKTTLEKLSAAPTVPEKPLPSRARGAKDYGPWKMVGESAGGGAQGDIHIVTHRDDPSQKRALKRLKNRERITRFKREIEVSLKLGDSKSGHPNIVLVLDHSLDDPAYLVMELCRGHLTQEVLAPLSLVEKVELFGSVCEALAHAHKSGVIHRDIKPENILIRDDGSVAVSDFGVCYVEDDQDATATGEVFRNWMCTPPELEDGKPEHRTPASDVYCLGKLLYWM